MSLVIIGQALGGLDSNTLVKTASAVPLVVDGQLLREDTSGPIYRATGYNAHFGATDSYPASTSLMTYEAMDKYFAQLRPNSLTRLRAYAPGTSSPNSGNWAAQLAVYDMVVAAARANGQRLILCLNNWGGDSGWDQFITNIAWVTGQQYLHSVAGANSYQDWAQTLATRYKGDYTVAIYDLVNEPVDNGSNTTAFQTWFDTAAGWIKAIDPGLLVYFGATAGGFSSANLPTVLAGMDLVSAHAYDNGGWLPIVSGVSSLSIADTLGKPLIVDETGVWAKEYYDSTDVAPEGGKAVTFEAQGKYWREQTLRMLAYPEICGTLYYSYMDNDNGQGRTDGKAHYEPVNESPLIEVVRTVNLRGDPFNASKMTAMTPLAAQWVDAAQALLWLPGATISQFKFWLQDSTGAVTATNPLAGSWNGIPSLLFTGAQYLTAGYWGAQKPQQTYFFSFVPTALPASGAWSYLSAPTGASTNGEAGIRINAAGKVELVVSAVTATPTPDADVIVGTSSNAVDLNDVNTLCVIWNTSGSASGGYAAGTWVIILNGVLVTGTQTKSLSVSFWGHLGISYDGTSDGFQGHVFQALMEWVCETPTIRAKTLAYLTSKYSL